MTRVCAISEHEYFGSDMRRQHGDKVPKGADTPKMSIMSYAMFLSYPYIFVVAAKSCLMVLSHPVELDVR